MRSPAELVAFLENRPEPQIVMDADFRIVAANAAYRRHYSGGIDVTGRRCYEVSHGYHRPCDECGEACPAAVSRASGEPARVLHLHHTPRGPEHVDVELTPIFDPAGRLTYFVERMSTVREAASQPDADGLIGRSSAFNRMLEAVRRVAPSHSTALLLGESGTGKELVARAIHARSPRAAGPLVTLECSGLAETLFESELFGYEKGAFTGAARKKPGLVEAAAGGTLFLDEVGDIPLGMQVKLLRLLESGTFRRVGGLDALAADFRLVAATHRDLKAMVAEGSFRADLYYRIAVFPIDLPALRERREDVSLLTEALLRRLAPYRAYRLADDTLRLLEAHDFPGNIRELRNILERAILLADGDTLQPAHLPAELAQAVPADGMNEIVPLADVERNYLRWALGQLHGDRRALAEQLGISERTLYRKLAG